MTRGRLLPLALAGLLAGGAGAATDAGANADSQALLQTYQQLLPQLQNNPYGQPLVIRSSESGRRVQGEVFAVLDFAQSLVSDNLDSPAAWCDLMMLPMNTKGCSVTADGALRVYIGKKTAQPLADASRIDFSFQRLRPTADELQIALAAPQGPLGTSDYRITLATVALPQGRSFVHLRYSYQVGLAGQLAFATYLNTVGRDKVGFSRATNQGVAGLVGGVRGIVERNAMRYYLALHAYLGSLAQAPAQQVESRLRAWFQHCERYPRQLHEMERTEYLDMKRAEIRRQGTPAS